MEALVLQNNFVDMFNDRSKKHNKIVHGGGGINKYKSFTRK